MLLMSTCHLAEVSFSSSSSFFVCDEEEPSGVSPCMEVDRPCVDLLLLPRHLLLLLLLLCRVQPCPLERALREEALFEEAKGGQVQGLSRRSTQHGKAAGRERIFRGAPQAVVTPLQPKPREEVWPGPR